MEACDWAPPRVVCDMNRLRGVAVPENTVWDLLLEIKLTLCKIMY